MSDSVINSEEIGLEEVPVAWFSNYAGPEEMVAAMCRE